jgi:hypothetical protein
VGALTAIAASLIQAEVGFFECAFASPPLLQIYPNIQPTGPNSACNNVKRVDIAFMGYSLRTNYWRYTVWLPFNGTINRAGFHTSSAILPMALFLLRARCRVRLRVRVCVCLVLAIFTHAIVHKHHRHSLILIGIGHDKSAGHWPNLVGYRYECIDKRSERPGWMAMAARCDFGGF